MRVIVIWNDEGMVPQVFLNEKPETLEDLKSNLIDEYGTDLDWVTNVDQNGVVTQSLVSDQIGAVLHIAEKEIDEM